MGPPPPEFTASGGTSLLHSEESKDLSSLTPGEKALYAVKQYLAREGLPHALSRLDTDTTTDQKRISSKRSGKGSLMRRISSRHHKDKSSVTSPSSTPGGPGSQNASPSKRMATGVGDDEILAVGWVTPLVVYETPAPHTLPLDVLSYEPCNDAIHKYFFKGTNREVQIRQIFLHSDMTAQENEWLTEFRNYCKAQKYDIAPKAEPMLMRIIWYNVRRSPSDYLIKSLEHLRQVVEWRRTFFPLSDRDEDLSQDLNKGIMYWVGRDSFLRPLLVIRLGRLPRGTAPERFKRLTIFCFEWALRYLLVPGKAETCTVLLDVRGVPLHSFPISALTDMVSTLTKHYPFRLNKMFIINDSFFVQTVWNIAKQFLTEVQQEKMQFYRSGFEAELLKDYGASQLETAFGGTREIKTFYPFPIAPPPYTPGKGVVADFTSPIDIFRAVDDVTVFGVMWEGNCRTPIQWAPEAAKIFAKYELPVPAYLLPKPTMTPPEAQASSLTDADPGEVDAAAATAAVGDSAAAATDATDTAAAVGGGAVVVVTSASMNDTEQGSKRSGGSVTSAQVSVGDRAGLSPEMQPSKSSSMVVEQSGSVSFSSADRQISGESWKLSSQSGVVDGTAGGSDAVSGPVSGVSEPISGAGGDEDAGRGPSAKSLSAPLQPLDVAADDSARRPSPPTQSNQGLPDVDASSASAATPPPGAPSSDSPPETHPLESSTSPKVENEGRSSQKGSGKCCKSGCSIQ